MLSIIAAFFNVIVAFVLPLGALLYFIIRKPRYTLPFIAGVLAFLGSQVLLRIPLLQLWLQKTMWFNAFQISNPVLYFLFLSFTAGLFEECGRYAGIRLLLKTRTTWADGMAFGLGHGGLEAILFGGLNSLLGLLFQSGQLALLPAAEVALTGLERIFAMTAHVGLSLMAMAGARRNQWLYLPLAIGLHTLFNFLPLLVQRYTGSIYLTEGLIGLQGAGFLLYIVLSKPKKETMRPAGAD